ncbi:gamma-glutamyl-gamma-aminobutyrate hydrolase family protein [Kribbella solani]|uniref:gamma-glutamyl-gamma-aminobutyrate hydrolase family protein n=1 Tax=Kribbella solani TaxID=236067 RepID=UPI0029A2E5F6|nr:gamma-glutamyl-gamma-aminobutyrate hydrolase family protein [Kribbella solani]MDX2967616.1 gamma-glutamyl-gamma-aminobutyrate hydrolase family protein [Kribbella solani]MDX3002548.1 gamma-glutamyl-gamma-aminobutyrate hydrolase family protein [Kribbella solani]
MVSNASDRPRIGITTYLEPAIWGIWQREAALLPRVYLDAVVAAGGTPLLLPPVGTDPSVLGVLDGLVIAGGCDVDPAAYGATPHPETIGTSPGRDQHDAALIQAALDWERPGRPTGLPLLAVCRGLQVLNVALGGTLHQHLPEVVAHDDHRPAPAVFGSTEIKVEPGSLTHRILGAQATGSCYHHQAIDVLAPALTVTARAGDGTIEAAEVADRAFALGIQWHPEETPDDLRLFTALIRSTR